MNTIQSKYLLFFLVDAWRIFPNDLKIMSTVNTYKRSADSSLFRKVTPLKFRSSIWWLEVRRLPEGNFSGAILKHLGKFMPICAQVTVQESIICFGGLRIIELVLPFAPRHVNAGMGDWYTSWSDGHGDMESWPAPLFSFIRTGGNDASDRAKIVVHQYNPPKKMGE